LALAAAAPSIVGAADWLGFAGKHCGPGSGGTIVMPEGSAHTLLPGHKLLSECQQACMKDIGCEGVGMKDTRDAFSPNCFFLRNIDVMQCTDDPDVDLFIAPKADLTRFEALGNAWRSIAGTNCYPGRGGELISQADSLPGHRSLVFCQKACLDVPTCDGFTWHDFKDAKSDNCYLRANIVLLECAHDPAFNMRLIPRSPPPPMPPTPPPTPPPTAPPSSTSTTTPPATTTSTTEPTTKPTATTRPPTTTRPATTTRRPTTTKPPKPTTTPVRPTSTERWTTTVPKTTAAAMTTKARTTSAPPTPKPTTTTKKPAATTTTKKIAATTTTKKDVATTTTPKPIPALTRFSSVTLPDMFAAEMKGLSFEGVVSCGDYAVFVPSYKAIIGLYNVVGNPIDAASNFERIDISKNDKTVSDIIALQRGLFSGGASVGQKVVFTPSDIQAVGVFDVGSKNFQIVDISAKMDKRNLMMKFRGAAAVDSKVVFAPYYACVVGVFDVDKNVFEAVDISNQAGMSPSGRMKFSSAASSEGKVVFAPFDADAIGVFDVALSSFKLVDVTPFAKGGAKFEGAAHVGSYIVFAPGNSKAIVAYDVKTGKIKKHDVGEKVLVDDDFKGATGIGGKAYFAPNKATVAGVYDVEKDEFTMVDVTSAEGNMKYMGAATVIPADTSKTPVVVFGPVFGGIGRLDAPKAAAGAARLNADLGAIVTPASAPAANLRWLGGLAGCGLVLMLSAGVAGAAMRRATQQQSPIRTLHFAAYEDEFHTAQQLVVDCDSDSAP